MVPSLFTAVSGVEGNQQFLSVVANNLANINTFGFKDSRALFADTLSETIRAPGVGAADGLQVGMGTSIDSITPEFTQGALQQTNNNTDMAIEGNGFFVVKGPGAAADNYTRNGAFHVDAAGYLVSATGQRVQGALAAGASATPVTPATTTVYPPVQVAAGATLQDVWIPTSIQTAAGPPAVTANVTGITVDSTGVINLSLDNGQTVAWGGVALANFSDPHSLLKIGENMYQATAGSGAAPTTYQPASANGLGTIQAGYLEQSNVDLGQQFSNLILAQRGLEANTRVVTASDENSCRIYSQ